MMLERWTVGRWSGHLHLHHRRHCLTWMDGGPDFRFFCNQNVNFLRFCGKEKYFSFERQQNQRLCSVIAINSGQANELSFVVSIFERTQFADIFRSIFGKSQFVVIVVELHFALLPRLDISAHSTISRIALRELPSHLIGLLRANLDGARCGAFDYFIIKCKPAHEPSTNWGVTNWAVIYHVNAQPFISLTPSLVASSQIVIRLDDVCIVHYAIYNTNNDSNVERIVLVSSSNNRK